MREFIVFVLFTSSIVTGHNIVKYTFNCTGKHVVGSPYVVCKSSFDHSIVRCRDEEVVVATICLGQTAEPMSKDCEHGGSSCLAKYDPLSKKKLAVELSNRIQQCLWKRSRCDLTMEEAKYEWDNKYIGCSKRRDFDYLAVFNLACVSKSLIFYMCQGSDPIRIPHAGYIMSPFFPLISDKELGTCAKIFNFTQPRTFHFIVQYVDLNDYRTMDWVRIDTITFNGKVSAGSIIYTGTGLDYHQYYSTTGLGFEIKFQRHGQDRLRGFLISYSVSEYVPSSTNTRSTTDMITPVIAASAAPLLPLLSNTIITCWIIILSAGMLAGSS